ncbi:tRNA (adenosine(37)-N6)-threonylcarbamoyltransferase complex dimerization subunit type 1 TsaB [Sporolactobacillus sp. CPB3-1]|uniref:tRNA (Adenosine(37)-N6)-threonylcarbamoyltransferase complex dimerization subunit type 1 TsaB n=1 Tax=Sporolactobacillus mangiferae TaxID=2940498 RepID=A0ABT0MDC3_9BACL|nr:tRNA (adenosine(37)-N6)-threonylcarbamoyltransferase complex dimerization subunit type 1 TsaB [Sporolactobacillus mangiferae]MCL1632866.1 tRNA (adenosine(37)-N6)-threonylcarbamoyltransferase complex dimerization subunit type 1 TsaB [Sporolactobacillus mangiferae]
MNVLAIDSSNLVMGVAVTTEDKVLAELTTNSRKNHSERLMPAIAQMVEAAGLKPEDLDRIVVAEGPGSYTGLRIGVTVAKMIAWTRKKELVGVSSLEVVAQNGRGFAGYIAPFFDARRGQVFAGLYEEKEGEIIPAAADRLVMIKDWLPELRKCGRPVLFLSNDLEKWGKLIAEEAYATLGESTQNVPRAAELARIGLRKTPVSDIHHFLPMYLRLAEAEAKWLAKQGR